MRQQCVLVRNVGIGVKTDRSYVINSLASFFIQHLNVFKHVLEVQIARVDLVRRQRVEHKRVIGVGRMSERDCSLLCCCCCHKFLCDCCFLYAIINGVALDCFESCFFNQTD